MNILIYAAKRDFDVQKAERYFKERRIPYAFVDLNINGCFLTANFISFLGHPIHVYILMAGRKRVLL